MLDTLLRLRDVQFVRYLAAAVGALAVDMGSFMTFLSLGVAAGLSAFAGYSLGIVANWFLLSRMVFGEEVAARGFARTQQKAIFVVATLSGLGLTTGIVSTASALGINVIVTKGFAIVLSFLVNWLIRKHFIFKPITSAA